MSIDKLVLNLPVVDYIEMFSDIDQLKEACRVLLNQDLELIKEMQQEIDDLSTEIKSIKFDDKTSGR